MKPKTKSKARHPKLSVAHALMVPIAIAGVPVAAARTAVRTIRLSPNRATVHNKMVAKRAAKPKR